jgi:alginate O-acetyltransferase complex protein AlgJ
MAAAALKSLVHKLTVIVFFVVVLLPVVFFTYDGKWLGKGDLVIRGRIEFPKRMGPGAFQTIDKWFADRLGFRYPLIYLGTEFHLGALGRPLNRFVVFGPDNWLFWTEDADRVPSTMADSRGRLRFTPAQIAKIQTELLAMRDRFAACGVPFFVAIAPNKQGLYREHVMSLPNGELPSRLDAMMASINPAARSMIVDLRDVMRPAKQRHAPVKLYNKTETHWNDLGAFYGYSALMDAMRHAGVKLPHPALTSLDAYTTSVKPYAGGDIALYSLFSPWRYPDEDVTLAAKSGAAQWPETQVAFNLFVSRNPGEQGRLLLIGDSFTGAVLRYLQQHFGEVVRNVSINVNGALVGRFKPDVAVLLMVERNLERLLLPLANPAQMCPPPGK